MARSKVEKEVVYVSGRVVGYQFNKLSSGKRTFHLKVDRATNTVYVPLLQRTIRVRPIVEYTTHFYEAY